MYQINTYYGHTIDYNNPKPTEIDIRDIAHNLSFENRFIGQTEKPYSVAQHCVLGSWILEEMGTPVLALQFLLHDATEAYVKDIPTPLKKMLGNCYQTIEERFHLAICARFDVFNFESERIKQMDLIMLATEKAQLLPPSTVEWTQLKGINQANIKIDSWTPERAEQEYLKQFYSLTEQLKNGRY